MTTILQPGLVVTFIMNNQRVENPFKIDWSKVKKQNMKHMEIHFGLCKYNYLIGSYTQAIRTLKNVRIRLKHLNSEYKITGLSERSCKEQK